MKISERDKLVSERLAVAAQFAKYVNDSVEQMVPVLMAMNGTNPVTSAGYLRKKYAAVNEAIEAVSAEMTGQFGGGYCYLRVQSYGLSIEFFHPTVKAHSAYIGRIDMAGIYTVEVWKVLEPLEMTAAEVAEKRAEMALLNVEIDSIRSRVYQIEQMLAV